ncbi:MAG: hypothetical protein ACKO37_05150 [Vampirovibrionales bacterium]
MNFFPRYDNTSLSSSRQVSTLKYLHDTHGQEHFTPPLGVYEPDVLQAGTTGLSITHQDSFGSPHGGHGHGSGHTMSRPYAPMPFHVAYFHPFIQDAFYRPNTLLMTGNQTPTLTGETLDPSRVINSTVWLYNPYATDGRYLSIAGNATSQTQDTSWRQLNSFVSEALDHIRFSQPGSKAMNPAEVMRANSQCPGKPWWLSRDYKVAPVQGTILTVDDTYKILVDSWQRLGFERKDLVRAFWDQPSSRWNVYFDHPRDTRKPKVFTPDGWERPGALPPILEKEIIYESQYGV